MTNFFPSIKEGVVEKHVKDCNCRKGTRDIRCIEETGTTKTKGK
jgi:hypothetical protein